MTPQENELAARLWARFGREYLTVKDLMEWYAPLGMAGVREIMHSKGFPLAPRPKGNSKLLRVQYQDFAVWVERQKNHIKI